MPARTPATEWDLDAPEPRTLRQARKAVDFCRRCGLYACATQGVFGEGPQDARLMLVGEQPDDREDLEGKPFVGPAGQLMDRIAEKAGVDRRQCYVTNAVKHFKFEPRGKRRIHKKPDAGEVRACRWWLDFEIEKVKPKIIVALGSTAATALTGDGAAILKRRGTIEEQLEGPPVLVSIHPSGILRIRDGEARAVQSRALQADLERAWVHSLDRE